MMESDDPRRDFRACIYFLQCDDDGPIKIGATQVSVQSRIKEMRKYSPHEIKWIGATVGDFRKEGRIKRRFEHLNIRSEWFRPGDDLLAFIDQHPVPDDVEGFERHRTSHDLKVELRRLCTPYGLTPSWRELRDMGVHPACADWMIGRLSPHRYWCQSWVDNVRLYLKQKEPEVAK